MLLLPLCAWGAFALRLDWRVSAYLDDLLPLVLVVVLVKPVVFLAFGLYYRYWRYASVKDMVAVLLAVSAASAVVSVCVMVGMVFGLVPGFPRSVLGIDWLLSLTCIGGARMSVRVIAESFARPGSDGADASQRRVLIAGAGEAGSLVAREIERNPQVGMTVVGFLDDDPVKLGKRIHGIPVLGALPRVGPIIDRYGVEEVIIAMPRAAGTVVRTVADACVRAGVASRTIPGVFELVDGQVSVSRLRHVDIADLLRRAPIEGTRDTGRYLAECTVLVTGAGGSIGRELCRQIGQAGPRRLILLGHGENSIFDVATELAERFPLLEIRRVLADIREPDRLGQVFAAWRPEVVFHAAAHKHVPLMEENPEEAITNNVEGTKHVLEAAVTYGTRRLVLISTDKAVSPSSVMGASKRVAEMLVQDAWTRTGRAFCVVRFGNVLGSRGSVVPEFRRQIERGGPVNVTHPEMKRFFMTIPEAVHLVLQAGGLSRGGELYVLDMGEQVKIVDLVTDLIKLSGFTPGQIPIRYSGIRPGEKLEEALWEDGADVAATSHPEILRVREPALGASHDLQRHVAAMVTAAGTGDPRAVIAALAGCVPAFQTQPEATLRPTGAPEGVGSEPPGTVDTE